MKKENNALKHNGFIVVFEGTDGSGKATQSAEFCKKLKAANIDHRLASFPQYQNESSTFVRAYLNGDYGSSADAVSPYTASTFYAMDRYAAVQKDNWYDYLKNGGIIVCDRYTTSNAVHQTAKFDKESDRIAYLKWLEHFEYQIMNIPAPNLVFFLDMPIEKTIKAMAQRENADASRKTLDIHERDTEFLKKSYQNACGVAEWWNWIRIHCANNQNEVRTIQDISEEIWNKFLSITKK